MTLRMTVTQAKARFLSVIDDVQQGEEIELTRHGRVVARLVPPPGPRAMRGSLTGRAISAASDDELFGIGEPWELP